MEMITRKIRISIIVTAVLSLTAVLSSTAFGTDVKITSDVDRTRLAVGEYLNYTISVTGDVRSLPEPTLPDLSKDFEVYSSGRNQSFSVGTGGISSSVIYNYMLVPKKEGQLTIWSASIEVDGKTYRSEPITITVTSPSSAAPPSPQNNSRRDATPPSGNGRVRLFAEAQLDRDTVYVNEPVTLTFRFYRGEQLYQTAQMTRPSLADFWQEDLPPKEQTYRVIDNIRYEVTGIKTALFPISAGKKTIGRFELSTAIRDRSGRRRDPFGFDDNFFSVFQRGKPVKLATKPLSLTVLPLPREGQPGDFSGLVGSFDITAVFDHTTVPVNEPITAKVTISGNGNIKSITEPKVQEPADFRLYNAGATENVSKAGYRVSGSKTFEEVFVPRRAGTYQLPSFTFSYFDPQQKRYISRQTEPVTVTVTPGDAEFSIPPLAKDAADLGYLAKDVRCLKTYTGKFHRHSTGFPFVLFGMFHLLPLAGVGVVVVLRRRRDRLESDVAYRRLRYAGKAARRRLRHAQKLFANGDAAQFYPAVTSALTDYLGDRFNRSGKGMVRAEIKGILNEAGIGSELIDEISAILDTCDQARFAPGAGETASMREVYERGVNALTELDRAMQKK